MTASKYPHRVTLDFRDEPEVLSSLKERAKKERRSAAGQLLLECLPALRKTKKGAN